MKSPNLVVFVPIVLLQVDYRLATALERLLILICKCICKIYQWSGCTILAFFIRAAGAKMTGRPPDWTRGRNLDRSQSLLNVRSGYAPMTEDVQPGNRSNSSTAVPASSAEEGLELLGTAATTEEYETASCHGEIDSHLLDYDSDTTRDTEGSTSAMNIASASAMDTDQAEQGLPPQPS
jgi:hypothetical protein